MVQHDLLWARLGAIGVSTRMLAASRLLYSSSALSMRVGSTAGPPLFVQKWSAAEVPPQPDPVWQLLDGLHGHLDGAALHAAVQLGSGRWLSPLGYADDGVLLFWTPAGVQVLLKSMHGFCQALGLTVSPSKTEALVFNGTAPGTWHVRQHVPPQSASFRYLGLVFDSLAACCQDLQSLRKMGKGAAARLNAKQEALVCSFSHDEAPV